MRVAKVLLAVAFSLLVTRPGLAEEDLDQLVKEFTGQVPARLRTAEELSAAYALVLDELLPGMGADDLAAREEPQQALERICFRVGRPGAEAERVALCKAMVDRLGDTSPRPARIWLLRQLERLSGGESVVDLARLLEVDDAEMWDLARRALQNNSATDAAAALRDALKKTTSPDRQIALINALAARRDVMAVPLLTVAVVSTDPSNEAVLLAAIAALGDLGGDDAWATLKGLWESGPPAIRAAAADALLCCADHYLEAGERKPAADICNAVYSSDAGLPTRMGALRLAVASRGRRLPTLLKLMMSDDAEYELRVLAAELAARLPERLATVALVNKLPEASPEGQVLMLQALAERGDPVARSVVTAAAKHQDTTVRTAALRALEDLGDQTSVMLLVQAAVDASGAERDAARHGLARLRGDGVDEAILGYLDNQNAALRVELIHTVAARRYAAGVPTLLACARDQREEAAVVVAALESLGELGTVEHAPALLALLASATEDKIIAAAEDAIVAVCLRVEDPGERVKPVLSMWEEAEPALRVSLVRMLGRIGGPEAAERIRAAQRSDREMVVDAAVRALAQWPNVDVLDDLLEIARTSEQQAHRILALRGYVRLLDLPNEREPIDTLQMIRQAWACAQRAEEQRLVLGGLAKVRHIDALALAEQHTGDAELAAEAEAAVITIAEAIGPLHREEAQAAIRRVIDATANETTRNRGQEALKALESTAGCITTWEVAGPYFEAGQDWQYVYDHAFQPESPEGGDVQWQPLAHTSIQEPWIVDLGKLYGGDQRCVYVRAAVWSDERREARLEVGSDDGVKVWLGGQIVHSAAVSRGHSPFEDKISITLESGWNPLLLKIVQIGGGWGFSCAVRSSDGSPLSGVRVRARPDGE